MAAFVIGIGAGKPHARAEIDIDTWRGNAPRSIEYDSGIRQAHVWHSRSCALRPMLWIAVNGAASASWIPGEAIKAALDTSGCPSHPRLGIS